MSESRESERHPVERSSRLLRAARTGDEESVRDGWAVLADYDSAWLSTRLSEADVRTAFWLNVYNAAVQHELRTAPETYDSRLRFFVAKRVTVAGKRLSLNDIEHGILRRSKSVFFLGYGPRLLQSRFERRHRVPWLDPRIHFALNCGAASCPPIAAYSADGLERELTLASESYLTTEVDYELDAGIVRVPQLFRWYHGDFGGRSGTLELLREYGTLPEGASPKLRYRPYDWSLALDNFHHGAGDALTASDSAGAGDETAGHEEPASTEP